MSIENVLSQPPPFFKLISHELRWQLLKALSESDLKVQELVKKLDRPQNLISYHLQKLRAGKLVTENRSLADARTIYYSLNLPEVQLLFEEAEEALHPALSAQELEDDDLAVLNIDPPVQVLFLCTHNSARSQMAEGILRTHGKGLVKVYSAGTEVSQVRPLAIRAMAEMNIDISHQYSKHLDEYREHHFDYIITVCDRARESCPVFPGDPVQIHWSFPDPAAVEGTEEERYAAFQETAVQLNTRIGFLLMMIKREAEER
jgi:thioredoxin type arsenate reductase